MNRLRIFFDLIISLITIIFKSIWKDRLPGKDSQKGEINILATGPSLIEELSNQDGQKRIGKINMVVNDFALSDYYEIVKPRYYCFADDAYWIDAKEANTADVIKRENVLNIIVEKTTWDMYIILPNVAKTSELWSLIQNKNSKLTLWSYNGSSISDSYQKLYFYCLNRNLVTPCANVLALGIYSSIYLGFNIINLYGVDHSWTKDLCVNDDNQICTIKRHMYAEPNEMIPWLKSDKTPFTMYSILTSLSSTFHQYEVLREYGCLKGAKIFNHTKNSFIDAFDRLNTI